MKRIARRCSKSRQSHESAATIHFVIFSRRLKRSARSRVKRSKMTLEVAAFSTAITTRQASLRIWKLMNTRCSSFMKTIWLKKVAENLISGCQQSKNRLRLARTWVRKSLKLSNIYFPKNLFSVPNSSKIITCSIPEYALDIMDCVSHFNFLTCPNYKDSTVCKELKTFVEKLETCGSKFNETFIVDFTFFDVTE